MLKNPFPPIRRYSLLLTTILILVGAFCVYYFVFLSSRENEIEARNFRVISRINQNMENKRDGIHQMVLGAGKHVASKLRNLSNGDRGLYIDKGISKDTAAPWKKDKNSLIQFSYSYYLPTLSENEEVSLLEQDTVADGSLNIFCVIDLPAHDVGEAPTKIGLCFKVPFGEFMKNLLRPDVFSDYILINGKKLAYTTIPTGFQLDNKDSLLRPFGGLKISDVTAVSINGKPYRMFVSPVHFAGQGQWLLAALQPSENYLAERNYIPVSFALLLMLLIFFGVLGIPFIKSLIMSASERLNARDVLFSSVSMMLATSLVTLILFNAWNYFYYHRKECNINLRELSKEINNNFKKELRYTISTLKDYDAWVKQNPDSVKKFKTGKAGQIDYMASMFYVDSAGNNCYDRNSNDSTLILNTRQYVRDVMNNQMIHDPKSVAKSFSIEPIYSWREGEFRVAVGIPVSDPEKKLSGMKVLAGTVPMRSVVDPVLPLGYGFCIIDNKGNTVFHSVKSKNLTQNFLEECSDERPLREVMVTRNPMFFDSRYEGRDCRMYAAPIKNFNYTLITFFDQEIAAELNQQVFGSVALLDALLLCFGAMIVVILFMTSYRRSALRIPRFQFSNYAPPAFSTEGMQRTDLPRYDRAFAFNMIMLGALWLFSFLTDHPITILFLLFASVPWAILYNFFLLRRADSRRSSSFFTVLFILMMVTGNIVAVCILSDFGWPFLAFEIVLFVAYKLAFILPEKAIPGFLARSLTLRKEYYLMMLSWLLIICVLPSVRFCQVIYNKENRTALQYSQLDFVRQIKERSDEWKNRDPNRYKLVTDSGIVSTYEHILGSRQLSGYVSGKNIGTEYRNFDSTLTWIRALNKNTPVSGKTLGTGAYDNSWQWRNNLSGDSMLFTAAVDGRDSLRLVTAIKNFRFPFLNDISIGSGFNLWGILFWLGVAVFIYILFKIIGFFVSRIFVLDLGSHISLAHLDKQFYAAKNDEHKLFIIGLPFAGKTNYFRKSGSEKQRQYIDLADAANDTNTETRKSWKDIFAELETWVKANNNSDCTVVLDHFEFALGDASVSRKKLDLLELLTRNYAVRVIIISTIEPHEMVEAAGNDFGDRWAKALISFCKLYFPLGGPAMHEQPFAPFARRWNTKNKTDLIRFIDTECSRGLFLQGIGTEMKNFVTLSPDHAGITESHIVLKVQSLAQAYYRTIWLSLSREEQSVLFDLAQDGLVNSRNIGVISLLYNKGLIRMANQPELMNLSFRNFILTDIAGSEEEIFEKDTRASGSWNTFRGPLLIVVAAMVLFIFKTQENEVVEYITAFAAALPLLIRLLSSLGDLGQKKNTSA